MSETTTNQKLFSKKVTWILLGVILLLLAILFTFLVWLYTGETNSTKEKVLSKVPLPVALVNTKPIYSNDLYKRLKVAEGIMTATGQTNPDLRKQILSNLIDNRKIALLAGERNIQIDRSEIDDAYKALYQELPGQGEADLAKELEQTYGLSVDTLKSDILQPSLVREHLSIWFNSQESLNKDQYAKARDLLNQLDTGSSFDEVANKYNQDVGSKDFAGDQGFVDEGSMLPEFRSEISMMSQGQQKLIPSRYGLHIIRLNGIEDNENGKSYSIQQIFLIPSDFNAWLDTQLENIKSIQLL